MFFRRKRRKVPALNTTSTADISFMLLIFFLVTTSMDMDKGLNRQLPPIDKQPSENRVIDVDKNIILRLAIDADNRLTINDSVAELSKLRRQVVDFLLHCPDRENHIISVTSDRGASYDTYFQLQNEIVAAYHTLREYRARRVYGHHFDECSAQQQQALREYYPQRIAEDYGRQPQAGKSQEGGEP